MGLTLCQEMEKLNVEVIQQGSLTNIIVEANIRDQIIAAQKENKGVAHIKERVNQVLEDMLRCCVLNYSNKWDECLPLAEFSYNNSYQESIRMAPFEALYGRRCRTSLSWLSLEKEGSLELTL